MERKYATDSYFANWRDPPPPIPQENSDLHIQETNLWTDAQSNVMSSYGIPCKALQSFLANSTVNVSLIIVNAFKTIKSKTQKQTNKTKILSITSDSFVDKI